jgi:hypothetical protein
MHDADGNGADGNDTGVYNTVARRAIAQKESEKEVLVKREAANRQALVAERKKLAELEERMRAKDEESRLAIEAERLRLKQEAEAERVELLARTEVEKVALLEAREAEWTSSREALEEKHRKTSATYKVRFVCKCTRVQECPQECY